MCIYYSHVAKLPSEIFTFILLDIGCSQPRPKKILSPVPLVRADTWNPLSAENKRLINTSSNSKVQGLWKNKNWRMGEVLLNAAIWTWHGYCTHGPCTRSSKPKLQDVWVGSVFSMPHPSQKLLALDGCWKRENHSLENIPTGKLSVALAGPMFMHVCAKRTQWSIEKERRKTKRDMKLRDGNMGGGHRVAGGEKWENGYNYISLNPCMKLKNKEKL